VSGESIPEAAARALLADTAGTIKVEVDELKKVRTISPARARLLLCWMPWAARRGVRGGGEDILSKNREPTSWTMPFSLLSMSS
jgi:hypothetical protein